MAGARAQYRRLRDTEAEDERNSERKFSSSSKITFLKTFASVERVTSEEINRVLSREGTVLPQVGEEFENFETSIEDSRPPSLPYSTLNVADFGSQRLHSSELFDFVEGGFFQTVVFFLISANVGFVTIELLGHGNKMSSEAGRLAEALLVCYCLELLCRICHQKSEFFTGFDDRLWNLADFVTIVGMLLWRFHSRADMANDGCLYAGAARAPRLVHIIRGLVPCVADGLQHLEWAKSDQFQWIVAGVIASNAILMGIELDSPSVLWRYVDQAMLLFFLFELSVRLRLVGCREFFVNADDITWNYLDFSVVVIGILDLWVARLIELVSGVGHSSGVGHLMMMVRMLRLLRVLRLLRLFRAFRQLRSLAICMTEAMQSIFWVLVLTTVAIYAVAILTTRMVGHGLLVSDPQDIPESTRVLFDSVCNSMFSLFSVMNGEEWNHVVPLLEKVPCTKPFFLFFIICSSWALLSVLTGVVSDHMATVREHEDGEVDEAEIMRQQWTFKSLRSVFSAADKDGGGTLNRSEYMQVFRSPFHLRKLQQVSGASPQDLAAMFDLLDVDGSGEVDWNEFFHGFSWLNEPITGKSILKIRHTVSYLVMKLRRHASEVSKHVTQLLQMEEETHDEIREALQEALDARRRLRIAKKQAANALSELNAARQEAEALSGS